MNYIEAIFERCNIDTISKFLIHGTQPLETNNNSLYDRNNKAYEKLNEWFTTQFPTFEEQNKHSGFVLSITYELESIYMQIGMQAGFMIAEEIYKNKNHPSAD